MTIVLPNVNLELEFWQLMENWINPVQISKEQNQLEIISIPMIFNLKMISFMFLEIWKKFRPI
jgi:hypothetical protein